MDGFMAAPNGQAQAPPEPSRTARSFPRVALEHTMNIQRLRNLTTGKLHTEMGHVYEDLEIITGVSGLMTHMLPRVMRACKPWLREHVQDQRFWDGAYDTGHTGDFDLPDPTAEDRAAMLSRYAAMPDPLVGKDVLAVLV